MRWTNGRIHWVVIKTIRTRTGDGVIWKLIGLFDTHQGAEQCIRRHQDFVESTTMRNALDTLDAFIEFSAQAITLTKQEED